MQTTISKAFRWEMAHRLPFHDGGCRNIHGHSYSMTVEVTGEPDMNGMVMDYFDLAALCEPLVKQVDHAFLCDNSDAEIKQFLVQTGLKAVFVDFPTTAEKIAEWFYDRFSDLMMPFKHLKRLRVVVSETERTSAEVSGDLRIATPSNVVLQHQAHMLE